VQRAKPFAGSEPLIISTGHIAQKGVQRAKPFAGAWGVPTSLSSSLPPQAA